MNSLREELVLIPVEPPSLRQREEDILLMKTVATYSHLTIIHKDNLPVGTVVMLRSQNRLFALTAAHCIHDMMAIHARIQQGVYSILKSINGEELLSLDIAILELENNPAVTACDIRQLCTEPLLPFDPKRESSTNMRRVWIVGFPVAMGKISPNKQHYFAQPCAIGTNVILADDRKLTLYYHSDTFRMDPGEVLFSTGKNPETPEGFSGGGVWSLEEPKPDELFNPIRHLKLHAIQYAWDPLSRKVFCVPSAVVKRLLLDHYPELKEEMEQ